MLLGLVHTTSVELWFHLHFLPYSLSDILICDPCLWSGTLVTLLWDAEVHAALILLKLQLELSLRIHQRLRKRHFFVKKKLNFETDEPDAIKFSLWVFYPVYKRFSVWKRARSSRILTRIETGLACHTDPCLLSEDTRLLNHRSRTFLTANKN